MRLVLEEINVLEEVHRPALHVASANEHETVVRLLLDKAAENNTQVGRYGTALQAASENRHDRVVKLLLDKGADVQAHGGHYGTALRTASASGHKTIVRLPLDKGADVPARGVIYGPVLRAASAGVARQLCDCSWAKWVWIKLGKDLLIRNAKRMIMILEHYR